MRATPLKLAASAAAAVLAATIPATSSAAGQAHTISVSPTTAKPGDTITVTGTSSCVSSEYVVTLSFTTPDDETSTTTATGTTDAEGGYSQPIVVPANATKGEPASVQSNIATCGQPNTEANEASRQGGGGSTSNTVNLTIAPHTGTLADNPVSGPPGTVVQLTGANCWGSDIIVAFHDGDSAFAEVTNVTLNPDRSFSGSFTIPAGTPAGQWFFGADCPGTDFADVSFVVSAAVVPAPPAAPVPGQPTFTG